MSFLAEDVGISDRASPASVSPFRYRDGRDPESGKMAENQMILDPTPKAAGDDELWYSRLGVGEWRTCNLPMNTRFDRGGWQKDKFGL